MFREGPRCVRLHYREIRGEGGGGVSSVSKGWRGGVVEGRVGEGLWREGGFLEELWKEGGFLEGRRVLEGWVVFGTRR